MVTETWLAALLQTTDSGFPSGSYAHSAGLEGLVELGAVAGLEGLRLYLLEQLVPGLERAELPFLRFAFEAARTRDFDLLGGLGAEYGAGRLMRESFQASLSLGRQRLDMLRRIQTSALLESFDEQCGGSGGAHLVIVSGVQAAAAGIPLEAALTAFGYAALAAAMAASFKLLRLGQISAQTLLSEALRALPPAIDRSKAVSRDEAAWFNPLLDIAAARHETAYTRLFIS